MNFTPPPPSRPTTSGRGRPRRRGFALIVTIVLVAFLVLILVGLATFTRVETQVAANSAELSQARQNALFALNVAVGELQKYAGPDQRATATADIDPASVAAGGGTAKWVGVWGNSANPQTALSSTPARLQWLVSGNERTAFNPASDVSYAAASFGQITTAPAAPAYTPASAVAGLSASSTATSGGLTVGGDRAVLLVGPKSVEFADDNAARSRAVIAPLVDIEVAPENVPGLGSGGGDVAVGRYAWWVGDEGVKARADVVDPYVTPTAAQTAASPAITADPDSLHRLAIAQRAGIEAMPGLADFPANDARLRGVLSTHQLPFLHNSITSEVARERFHDVTVHSRGVIADSLRGGLRRDLTFAFAQNLSDFRAALDLGGGGATTVASTNPLTPAANGPTWEQLRSFAQPLHATDPVTPRAQTALEHGIHPILVMAKLFIGGNSEPTADPDTHRFKLYYFPGFVLANPTTRTIAAATYTITVSVGGNGPTIRAYAGGGGELSGWGGVTLRDSFDGAVFELFCPELAPGEARPFVLSDGDAMGEHAWSSPYRFAMENDWESGNAPFNSIAFSPSTEVTFPRAYIRGVDHTPPPDDGLGIRFGASVTAGQSTNLGFTLSDSAGRVLQRVSGFELPSVQSESNLFLKSNETGGYSMPRGNPRRLQSGWIFRMADLAVDHVQHLGYSAGVSLGSDRYRPPLWSQHNMRAPLHIRSDHQGASNQAIAPALWGSIPANHPNWFYSKFIYDVDQSDPEVFTVEWAGGVRFEASSSAANYPYSRASWRRFDHPATTYSSGPADELVSLAQLQHFNTGGYLEGAASPEPVLYLGAAHAIGNSRAMPYIPRQSTDRGSGAAGTFYDQSYLLNRQLFDGYFFSTYPQGTASVDAHTRLPNPRFWPSGSTTLADTAAMRTDARSAAAHLTIGGAFNVNSTSVQAWRAQLRGLAGTRYGTHTSLSGPFLRSLHQRGLIADPATATADAVWEGFRNLNNTALENLATEIVAEIRRRGPALSLADFVNRRLITSGSDDATDPIGTAGAIQRALDSVTAINGTFPEEVPTLNASTGALHPPNTPNRKTRPTQAPLGLHVDSAHLSPSQFEGTPGYVTQADILQPLAPILAARSDTFRIRTYGEVVNPVTGERSGRAWCEAIVQRAPDYLDSSEAAAADPATDANRRFGRRFTIVSFRWLTADDI